MIVFQCPSPPLPSPKRLPKRQRSRGQQEITVVREGMTFSMIKICGSFSVFKCLRCSLLNENFQTCSLLTKDLFSLDAVKAFSMNPPSAGTQSHLNRDSLCGGLHPCCLRHEPGLLLFSTLLLELPCNSFQGGGECQTVLRALMLGAKEALGEKDVQGKG